MNTTAEIFLFETDVQSKRIILRALREINAAVKSFDSFEQLEQATPKTIDCVIVSADANVSLNKIQALFTKYKQINPYVTTCVISNRQLKNFPCVVVRPFQFNFFLRKITIEFYKHNPGVYKNRFDFVGVGIASSTGGPLTLQHYFADLPYTERAAFFVVLHAPDWMLETYAERLDSTSAYSIKLAQDGTKILPGNVYIAPGDFHMYVDGRNKALKLSKDEPYNFLRPAADPLFFTIAENFGSKSLGVVFTGMGHDGSLGAGKIKAAGGKVLVQSPDTAVIHAMPQSVIELGIADKVAPVDEMAAETLKLIRRLSARKK